MTTPTTYGRTWDDDPWPVATSVEGAAVHPDELVGTLQDWRELRRERDQLREELERKDRMLQMIVDDNYLLSRKDDWERLAVRHIITARAALSGPEECKGGH